ncbi:MAG: DNA mismatch repair protein MutS [SAR202 cluster bacterium Io17-Chloro-G3]|nr:MAG: DNA mismatch repair protein MutS [SAR202 cluster bacterium Io17-Chloro-G3]
MTTPVRSQYLRIKKQHSDAILLFRLGDFYETFDDDARVVSSELDIVLTSREIGKGEKVPLAGIPYHALDGYLSRLVKKGHKVAICEQITDPKNSKGLLEREVVRVVTPGTIIEPLLLQDDANNFLVAVVAEGDVAGLAYTDVTTGGQIAVTQLPFNALAPELDRLQPAETVVPTVLKSAILGTTGTITTCDAPTLEMSRQALLNLLEVSSLEGYGCNHLPLAIRSAGLLRRYLEENGRETLNSIVQLRTYSTEHYMTLDSQTRRNLELFQNGRWNDPAISLFAILNLTTTPMGARLLREWIGQPLLNPESIHKRMDAVSWFCAKFHRVKNVRNKLRLIADLERIVGRIEARKISPRELIALSQSLEALPNLLQEFNESDDVIELNQLISQKVIWGECDEVALLLRASLKDEPGQVGEGTVIKEGYSPELDDVREASRNAKGYIARLEEKERDRTGIRNLKVGYNRVFGYYIEITKSNLTQVPEEYQRRQSLTGSERFVTQELKEFEELVLNAKEHLEELEHKLYYQICEQIGVRRKELLEAAAIVAHIDVYASLADASDRYGYVRPDVNDGDAIQIVDGRHPVVERLIPTGRFVSNNAHLSLTDEQLIVLTGPNMSGKSTYLRQTALIVLMAQIGSFVPAKEANIGVVDRIFTRVGLQDDLSAGQSTFMVEMVEAAGIINNATKRSLVILDEIGRGTSTYDGLAIAQAVAEYIHNHPRMGCRTLFATHYHELTKLADTFPRIRNYTVSVAEEDDNVIFLHRIVPGMAARSYGVHVAQLAGLPKAIIKRAWEVLSQLEQGSINASFSEQPSLATHSASNNETQLPLITSTIQPHKVIDELLSLDVTSMTPIEALNTLHALQLSAEDSASSIDRL